MRSYVTLKGLGKRDYVRQLRSDLCKKAYERLMALTVVAPSIREEFTPAAITDPDYALPAINAWCDDAASMQVMSEGALRHREEMLRGMIASLSSDESDERRARRDFREADPTWKRVYADADYQETLRRGLAAVEALPVKWRSDPTAVLADPECRAYIDRKFEIERQYGADQTHPWDRCDTPDRFARWLGSLAIMVWEIVPFADAALVNGPFEKPLLEEAHAKAVDLAHIISVRPPALPPRPPQTKAEGKAYLLELQSWAKALLPVGGAPKSESPPKVVADAPPPTDAAPEHHPDGPLSPNEFWWDGRVNELPPIPFRLVEFLWNCPDRRCGMDHVIDHVWGDGDETPSGFKNAQSRINPKLSELDCPLRIRVKGPSVLLSE
jgi:hypothetical protein